jgi:hypothetical protein
VPDDVAEQIRVDAVARRVQSLAEMLLISRVLQKRLQDR